VVCFELWRERRKRKRKTPHNKTKKKPPSPKEKNFGESSAHSPISKMQSYDERIGIIFLNFFMICIGAILNTLGILLWGRKVPPNRFLGINLGALSQNKGTKQESFFFFCPPKQTKKNRCCFDFFFFVCLVLFFSLRCIHSQVRCLIQDVWYEVNEYVGKVICAEGVFVILIALLFAALPSSFSLLARAITYAVLFILSMVFVILLCVSRAKAFTRPSGLDFDNL
jgi:hypothetical protein